VVLVKPRTILVHEYVTGGGFQALPETPSLRAEGETMLRAVLADFKAWGQARILTTRDPRLEGPAFEADQTISLDPTAHAEGFAELAGRVDAVLVIAPEENGVLAELSALVLAAGAGLLGSLPQGVRAAGDKWICHNFLRKAGLPGPDTVLAGPGQARAAARDFGFPVVLKTVDGQGSLGVCLATDQASLDKSLELLGEAKPLLVQGYQEGVQASASLLVCEQGVLPLCLNAQDIRPGIPFSYQGGVTPLAHPEAASALALAARAVRAIPGLRGFVGVDLVLGSNGCLVIEVNPRLTVAYAGVRRVVDCNLAQAITAACLDGVLPERIEVSGQVRFGEKG
jgi:hypothetical protein